MQNKNIILAILFALGIILFAGFCSADVQLSKLGNEFSSASNNNYLTANPLHCSSAEGTCGWVSGTDSIVGVYYSRANTWGGALTWNFDLSGVDLNNVDRAEVKVSWGSIVGKGVHGPTTTGQANVKINGNQIASLITNGTKINNDYYAHPTGVFYLTFPFSTSLLGASTGVTLETGVNTLWDVKQVSLYIYESNKTVRIVSGKFVINGNDFLVKGVVYSPWIAGTGPNSASEQPFPGENEDVTLKMNNLGFGSVYVTDYNSDGKIQMWEVIQYDLEKMKAAGVNTIRTYSSGGWHDRNLNNIVDAGENVQGDMPDWFYDRILSFANANNMKVIIGYWVEEEDRAGSAPYTCDFNDLEVAKKTLGRVVNKYKDNEALLAWGIGNEVKLGMNQVGFSWGVDSNEYINRLNDYVRTLDKNHPIIYAKYVGEQTDFNNINSEVIAVNAWVNNSQEMRNAGEFAISSPMGRAYMLGEYAHELVDADDHWDLAKQYAGGCFLEHNDVWWKGVGYYFGILDQYRKIVPVRFSKLLYLYTGQTAICSANSQCGIDGFVGVAFCNASNNKQVLKNYTTNICNNAGLPTSSCSSITAPKVSSTCNGNDVCDAGVCKAVVITCSNNSQCGTDGFVGTPICNASNNKQVLRNFVSYACSNPGTSNSSCSNSTSLRLESTCSASQACDAGVCKPQTNIVCNFSNECGNSSFVGEPFCNGKDIWGNYSQYLCINPGTVQSYCEHKYVPAVKQACSVSCANATCVGENPNLIFYESFQNNYSIAQNGGTLNDGAYRFLSTVKCGNSIYFENGTYLNYSLAGRWPTPGNNFTLYFNVRPTNRTKYGLFDIGRLSGLNPNSMGIFGNGGRVIVEIRNKDKVMHQRELSNFTHEKWNFVAVTFQYVSATCADIKLYVNGKSSGLYRVCNFYPNLTGDMWIGKNAYYGPSYSYMDEFYIFNYAKTNTELDKAYAEAMSCTGQDVPKIACNASSDCGTPIWTLPGYCSGKDIYAPKTTFYCANPGTIQSYCYNYTYNTKNQTCEYACSYGACADPAVFSTFYEPFNNLLNVSLRQGIIKNGNFTFVSTKCGNAANMSKGQYIEYPVAGNFPTLLPASVEFWFYPSNRSSYGLFGIDVLQGRPNTLGIFVNSKTLYVEMKNKTTGFQFYGNNIVLDNSWNHVALTFNRALNGCSIASLYLNGKKQFIERTICNYAPLGNQTMYLGYSGFYGPSYGLVDEYKVVDYTLSSTEVFTDYARMANCTSDKIVIVPNKKSWFEKLRLR